MHKTSDIIVRELEAMTQQLQDYVLDQRLFKTITIFGPKGNRLMKMTIGIMLEHIVTLQSLSSDNEVVQVVEQAQEALEREQRSQPTRFFKLLTREAKSYTDSWRWFLQNCWESNAECTSDYAQEVNIRLRLERLLEYGGNHPDLAESRRRITLLDQRLRAIWEEGKQAIIGNEQQFRPEQYWWLYGQPRPQDAR